MSLDKQNNSKPMEENYNKLACSVSKASNEIMLHRISGGKDIEFPFCSTYKD